MINIVLLEPRIPQNTGNIGRLCVALEARLHLIHPLGFCIDDKSLKRAGLDYWVHLDLKEWSSLEQFHSQHKIESNHYFLSTKAKDFYFEREFEDEIFLYFGREDCGLPEELIFANYKNSLKIPMGKNVRSLNIANSVAIVAYEVYRQNAPLKMQ